MPITLAEQASCEPCVAADDDCAICGDGNVYEGNEIVFCDGCDVAVHQLCYDIREIPEGDEKFFCCCCALHLKNSEVSCDLCPVRKAKAPMRPVQGERGAFVHCFCASFFPECEIKRKRGGIRQIDTSKVDRGGKYFCIYCHRSTGVPVRCVAEGCTKYFHPMCALSNASPSEAVFKGYTPENVPVLACADHEKEFRRACLAEGEVLSDRFRSGDAVDVRYHGGKFWFRAVIVRSKSRQLYHVRYLDGEEERNVERYKIRIRDAMQGEANSPDGQPRSPGDGSFEDEGGLVDADSEYERIRLDNLRRNQDFLAKLGLEEVAKSSTGTKRPRKSKSLARPRRSKRSSGVLSHAEKLAQRKAEEREARRLLEERRKEELMAKLREQHHKALQSKMQRQEKAERRQMIAEDRLSRKLRQRTKFEERAKLRKGREGARLALNRQKAMKKARRLESASEGGRTIKDKNVDLVYDFEDPAWRSVTDEISCELCGGKENDLDSCEGPFLMPPFRGPNNEMVWVHANCATWSPEVYLSTRDQALCNVLSAVKRGKKVKCALEGCGRKGATIGCFVRKCKRSYHLRCALATGWCFRGQARFWCEEHREGPHDLTDDSPIEHGPLTGIYCKFCNDPDPKLEDQYVTCTADECNNKWHLHCAAVDADDRERIASWLCQPCQIQQDEENAVYCICRQPAQEDEVYLGCEGCQDWFHPTCLNISDAQADAIAKSDKEWYCPTCVELLDVICICRQPRSASDTAADLVVCDGCLQEFHRSCTGVALDEAYTCDACVRFLSTKRKGRGRAKAKKAARPSTPTPEKRKRIKLICRQADEPSPLSSELQAVTL